MPPAPDDSQSLKLQLVEGVFDDIDAMSARALEWDQEYEQIGRGPFHGHLTQLIFENLQLGRVRWSPGILHNAPKDTWVFGLPLKAEGSLHVRRRPVQEGELLAAISLDGVGFTATGATDLMVVVLPRDLIARWLQYRRGVDGVDPRLPPRHWAVSPGELARRANALCALLDNLLDRSGIDFIQNGLPHVESKVSDIILDMIPSVEIVESLHSSARIARAVLKLLHDRSDNPPSVTEMCQLVGARERTLFLSCMEAFGRSPLQLSLELRLNAVHRAFLHPGSGAKVTGVAAQFGFVHFGRFAAMYSRRFGELPSATLAKALGAA